MVPSPPRVSPTRGLEKKITKLVPAAQAVVSSNVHTVKYTRFAGYHPSYLIVQANYEI